MLFASLIIVSFFLIGSIYIRHFHSFNVLHHSPLHSLLRVLKETIFGLLGTVIVMILLCSRSFYLKRKMSKKFVSTIMRGKIFLKDLVSNISLDKLLYIFWIHSICKSLLSLLFFFFFFLIYIMIKISSIV